MLPIHIHGSQKMGSGHRGTGKYVQSNTTNNHTQRVLLLRVDETETRPVASSVLTTALRPRIRIRRYNFCVLEKKPHCSFIVALSISPYQICAFAGTGHIERAQRRQGFRLDKIKTPRDNTTVVGHVDDCSLAWVNFVCFYQEDA